MSAEPNPFPYFKGFEVGVVCGWWSGMEIKVPPFKVKHTLKKVTIEVRISLPHNANSACPLNTGPMWRLLPSWQFNVQKDCAEVESKHPALVPKMSWRCQAKQRLPHPLPRAHQTSLLPPTLYASPNLSGSDELGTSQPSSFVSASFAAQFAKRFWIFSLSSFPGRTACPRRKAVVYLPTCE